MIVELIITALFTIGVVYYMVDDEQVWVLEKEGEEWKPVLKYRKDLTEGEEYTTDYSSAFKGAKRRNFWKTDKLIR